jgi:hypothetical protein
LRNAGEWSSGTTFDQAIDRWNYRTNPKPYEVAVIWVTLDTYVSSWSPALDPEQRQNLAQRLGERALFNATGCSVQGDQIVCHHLTNNLLGFLLKREWDRNRDKTAGEPVPMFRRGAGFVPTVES